MTYSLQDSSLPPAALPNGFVDLGDSEVKLIREYVKKIAKVYERYGFDLLETPLIEFSSSLGSFLPDDDRPNSGVFSFGDGGNNPLSLRYDLTAPLARFISQNFQTLVKPHRSYRFGYVFRNENPGAGRLRQFMQMDADTVGAPGSEADAELCMMMADVLDELGLTRSDYNIRINNRKLLDGLLRQIAIDDSAQGYRQKLAVMRAIDKLERLGLDAVTALLGKGRLDRSGDFTTGANLNPNQIARVLDFVTARDSDTASTLTKLAPIVEASESGREGLREINEMAELFSATGYDDGRMLFDPSVVRGLEYYTGAVFEVELTFELFDDRGRAVNLGALASGGRYDNLVARFLQQSIPATGCSFGISRMIEAAKLINNGTKNLISSAPHLGPVVVIVMEKNRKVHYQCLVNSLRKAGIRAELYLGEAGIRAQLKYADRRKAPCVIIQGEDERHDQVIQIKDLIEGARLSRQISDNASWRAGRPAQITVPENALVTTVKDILDSHSRNR